MKKALMVGINAYPHSPLNGCVNDVKVFRGYALGKNFQPDNLKSLLDGDATTAAILSGLEWLVAGAQPGDTLVFYYSGHGVQVPTGDPTEPDGLSEACCPVDFDWTPQHMITDKDFVRIFSKIPSGVIFNWISDSCHSGDLTRGMGRAITGFFTKAMNVFHGAPTEKPKTIPLPRDIQTSVRLAKSKGLVARGIVGNKLEVGFISGCRSDQTSADAYIENRPCGALSYYFMKNVKSMPPETPLTEIVAATSKDLAANGYSQRPQAEGTRANNPFLA